MAEFKPMLAASLTDSSKIQFPVLVSPKLDGIRCVVINGQVLSRKLKPIPNKFIVDAILKEADGMDLDGEIMVNEGDFNSVQSAVMREDGEPDFRYFVFDTISGDKAVNRLSLVKNKFGTKKLNAVGANDKNPHRILFLDHNFAHSVEDLVRYEEEALKQGYEGAMLRSPEGKYKFGRSTENEGYLVKMKRFYDAEATVIGFECKYHNANEATKDELGRTKRSSHQANLVPMEMLGALKMQAFIESGKKDVGSVLVEFSIGTGFNDAQRKEIWENKEKYMGAVVTYKYQELSKYYVPRFPVFKCFRKD